MVQFFLVKLLAYSTQIFWSGTPWWAVSMEPLRSYSKVFFQLSYYMKSSINNWQVVDKLCSRPLVTFLNMTCIFQHSHKKWRDGSYSLHLLSIQFSSALCIYLTFTAQYSNIFLNSFLTSSCCCSIYMLEVKFWPP